MLITLSLPQFFVTPFFGTSLFELSWAALLFLFTLLVIKIGQKMILRRLDRVVEKTENDIDDALVHMVRSIRPAFYWFIAFYVAVQVLDLTGVADTIIDFVLVVWVSYQVIRAIEIFADSLIDSRLIDDEDPSSRIIASLLRGITKIGLWAIGILFVLSNFGVNITSLITGLGIGGVAVALAGQKILEDLFSSLSIYFDKPFVPGDFVAIGDDVGTVKKVGIKTTRIQSLSGEQLIIPNTNITSMRVHNYERMEERRIEFRVGVTYETGLDKLKEIPGMIEEAVNNATGVRFDRAHFLEFADSALEFEIVYFVQSKEYTDYVDAHHQVLLHMKDRFDAEGIDFAYPTRTVHVNQMTPPASG